MGVGNPKGLNSMAKIGVWCRAMAFIASFNYISVLMWRSDLFVEETEYTEKTTDLPQVTDKLCQTVLYLVQLAVRRIQTPDFNGDSHWLQR